MKNILLLSLLTLGFISCNSSGDTKSATPVNTSSNSTPLVTPPTIKTDSNTRPTGTTNAITTTPVTATTKETKSAGTGALNPAHGAPGHRCDIAVGAPLNSAPTNVPAPSITTTAPAPAQAQPAQKPTDSKVRLNPPHGAPGHDCAVQVGQPLKS